MPAAGRGRIAVDTSVAVPLVLGDHTAHEPVTRWRARRPLAVCGHAWVETYAVLTRLPGAARLTPADAARVLASQFEPPLAAAAETCARAVDLLADAGITGGATYDGWIALTALDHRATLASRDARAEATYRRLGVEVALVV